jgi:hypothetical protein
MSFFPFFLERPALSPVAEKPSGQLTFVGIRRVTIDRGVMPPAVMTVASISIASIIAVLILAGSAAAAAFAHAETNFLPAARAAFWIGKTFFFKKLLFALVEYKLGLAVFADQPTVFRGRRASFGFETKQTFDRSKQTHKSLL